MNNASLISKLPKECQTLQIKPRHKVALEHFAISDGTIWIVLLTSMPGDFPKAWHMTKQEYWKIQPKHGTRDRWIRENIPPTISEKPNPPKPIQQLFF